MANNLLFTVLIWSFKIKLALHQSDTHATWKLSVTWHLYTLLEKCNFPMTPNVRQSVCHTILKREGTSAALSASSVINIAIKDCILLSCVKAAPINCQTLASSASAPNTSDLFAQNSKINYHVKGINREREKVFYRDAQHLKIGAAPGCSRWWIKQPSKRSFILELSIGKCNVMSKSW